MSHSSMDSTHFSIENIPYGIASCYFHPNKSVVTRFEEHIIFLDELANKGYLSELPESTVGTFSHVRDVFGDFRNADIN